MRPVITDPTGTRRVDTPRVVEVQRPEGRRHRVVMPERAPRPWRRVVLLVLSVASVLLAAAGYWVFR